MKDDIIITACQGCGEEIYYLIRLEKGVPKLVESVCPVCGCRNIGLSGELKVVEEQLHKATLALKTVLEQMGINATIEVKVSLDDTGTSVRVRSCSFVNSDAEPDP